MTLQISVATFISESFVELFGFYSTAFGLTEIDEMHTDIFRAADVDGVMLGFSAPVVYDMLNIAEWRDYKGTNQYLTFECESDEKVTELTARVVELGGRVLHEPYRTYYGAWQSVLADTENNVFRINHFG
jgi:uncharacterized glyoxalase superfamily protein PhnB